METTLSTPRVRGRKPVSALGKLSIAALIVIGLDLIFLLAYLIGEVIPPLAVFAALSFVFAGLIALGFRWAPVLAVLISALLVAMNFEPMLAAVMSPTVSFPMFVLGATMLPAAIVGIIAGIAATVQNYRFAPEARRAPRGFAFAVTALVAIVAGGLIVAAMPVQGMATGISPETLDSLPVVSAANFEFGQKELRVKVGETVAYKLTNADKEAHYLDIDELNVHAPIPAGKTGLAVFKATTPGTYLFYCHPHADKASGEGMVGKLIIE